MTRSVEIPEAAVEDALRAFVEHRTNTKESRMRAALLAALPYLAPAAHNHSGRCCCLYAREADSYEPVRYCPACAEHATDAPPAGDGGLREALEKLIQDNVVVDRRPRDKHGPIGRLPEARVPTSVLQDLIAAHPAAPAVPQPAGSVASRRQVEQVLRERMLDSNFTPIKHDPLRTQVIDQWVDVLAGALFFSGVFREAAVPQPVDREALEQLFETHGVFETTFISTEIVEGRRRILAEAVEALLNGPECTCHITDLDERIWSRDCARHPHA